MLLILTQCETYKLLSFGKVLYMKGFELAQILISSLLGIESGMGVLGLTD